MDKKERKTKAKSGDKRIGNVDIAVVVLAQSRRIDWKRNKKDYERSPVIFPSTRKKDGAGQREDSVPRSLSSSAKIMATLSIIPDTESEPSKKNHISIGTQPTLDESTNGSIYNRKKQLEKPNIPLSFSFFFPRALPNSLWHDPEMECST